MAVFLMDNHQGSLALQALYAMPRPIWNMRVYKLAITLHLMQSPKQTQQAELLIAEFGKSYMEVANPLAPTDLPPMRIDLPLRATQQEKYKLWMYYQAALTETTWGRKKEEYEKWRHEVGRRQSMRRSSSIARWALGRLNLAGNEEDLEQTNKIDMDNTMIFTALTSKQFEYGWEIYCRMGDDVNEFTPRVVMHLCWRAFSETPMMTHLSRRAEWESRAWEVYGRFMCSEYLHPEQPETPGFLYDLMSITAFSAEKRERVRYTKTISVYNLLQRLRLDNLLADDQIVAPVLCMFLLECKGAPATIVETCHKAFKVWQTKRQLESEQSESFSLYWALSVLCTRSGNKVDFIQVLEDILEILDRHAESGEAITLPTSLLCPIQTFHDRYLRCGGHRDVDKCYFDDYIFRRVKYTNDDDSKEESSNNNNKGVEMDAFGFVRALEIRDYDSSALVEPEPEPIAYVDHALHKRTNFQDALAINLAMAAATGALKDEKLEQRRVFITRDKAESLIHHCLDVVSKTS